MRKRPIRGESSSAAHKRQAVTPASSSSASLAQQGSSLSIPKTPTHLTADLILPFVADRATWNSACSDSEDLCLTGKKMTPPWPNKPFNLGHSEAHVAFSPSASQLAFCIKHCNTRQCVIHVWDRWGKQILLEGHTGFVTCCLERSLDGEHLASGSGDG
jgi:hypothetical protein